MDDQPKAFERDLRSILKCESGSVPPRRSRLLLYFVGPASLAIAMAITVIAVRPSFVPPAAAPEGTAQVAVAAPRLAPKPTPPALAGAPLAPASVPRIAPSAEPAARAPQALAERDPAPRPRRRAAPATAATVQNVSATGSARAAMANPTMNERETKGSASHDQKPIEVAQIIVEQRQAAARMDARDALRELRMH